MSEHSIGKVPVSGVLRQRKAEALTCEEVASPLDPNPSSKFVFANRIVW